MCNVLYSNVDGLLNKRSELLSRINYFKSTIIALSEIKPKNISSFSEAEFSIPNFDMFLNSNIQRGVAIYVNKALNAQECTDFNSSPFQESVWCTFNSISDGRVLIGCIYRSPNTSTQENDENLFNLLKSEGMVKYDKICIVGDFNFPKVNWEGEWAGEKNREIIQNIQDAFLIQKVLCPTRRRPHQNPTLDDWVLVNDEKLISDVTHHDPLGKSDHNVLTFQLNISFSNETTETKHIYCLNRGNYTKLRDFVRDQDWSSLHKLEVNETWEYLKEVLLKGMEECIPKIATKNFKQSRPIWMNKKALKSIKKKYNSYKRYLKTKSGRAYQSYIRERNLCAKVLKRTRIDYERNIAKQSKENPKMFWKYVQEKMKVNTGISALKDNYGHFAVSDKDKAEVLNNFFTSVFTKENKDSIPDMTEGCFSDGVLLTEIIVTPLAVKNKLLGLNHNKSQGPDRIPPRILKEVAEEISTPLSLLFNKSLETGILPDDWKSAEVTAIFKKGAKSDPGNYRPVSLTCIVCKVLESIIRDAVVAHFTDNHLYSDCQHGFRKQRSCVTQLLEVMEDITLLLDKNQEIDILYLDFKKAFDTVPHERLLRKLSAYGISGVLGKWIRNFLSYRTQHVRIGSEKSSKSNVLSGIPQGSILGPVLFTIFINDLPESVLSTCKVFADDTKLYNNNLLNSNHMQNDIFELQKWSNKWDLHFNVSKCGVLHIGNNHINCKYFMVLNNIMEEIKIVKEERDLGVVFDGSLSFDSHIHKIVCKANQMLGIIKRAFDFLDKEIFLKLYKSFVRPHLEYANTVWCPYLKRQSVLIEKVQRRATKLLKECQNLSYAERLKYLKLHSLKGRRVRGDLIQAYKIINGVDDIDANTFFSFVNSNTRNSDLKIFIQHCRTNKRKFFFSNRVAKNWNALPVHIKSAHNTNSFKNQVDKIPKFLEMFYDFD